MYVNNYQKPALDQLATCAPQPQTALGEISQRLSSASIRVNDVNARLRDIHAKTFGSTPEPVEKQNTIPAAHSAITEIQNMFDVLEQRLLELGGRANALNRIA